MEYALVKRVSEIVQQDSLKEFSQQKETFCDKMNNLFSSVSSADIANAGADVTSFISALHSTTSMQAIIPPDILEGLQKGTYKFNKSNGEVLAQIVNSQNGKIVAELRLEEVHRLANPAGMNTLSLQMATQMKLSEIQGLIEDLSVQVNRKLDAIIQSQVDEKLTEADTALSKFIDYRYNPDLKVELKDVKSDVVKSIFSLKRDIKNRIESLNEVESRKKNLWKETVTNVDRKDAEKNVLFIREEILYLHILFMVKYYITKDNQDLKDYSDYLNTVFTEKCRYILTAWEYNPNKNINFFEKYKKKCIKYFEEHPYMLNSIERNILTACKYNPNKKESVNSENFWFGGFEKHLNQITEIANEPILLENKNYEYL